MWHIVVIGYAFTTLMLAVAQEGIARKLIYLFFFTVLPLLFVFWVSIIRHRNRLIKLAEQNKKHDA